MSTISLPKRVKIGHQVVPINLVDRIEIDGGTHYVGSHQYGVGINIKTGSPSKAYEAETLLHELFHALYQDSHLGQTPGVEEHHELIVSQFGTRFAALLKDNPKLIKYLQGALK